MKSFGTKNVPRGGQGGSPVWEKFQKITNFYSDPFPKLKEWISVKNILRKKTTMTKKMTLQKKFFASLNLQELSKLTS